MIKCNLEQLPPPEEISLRSWLSKGSLEILLRVIKSQVQFHQVKALEEMLSADQGNDKELSAKGHFAEAQKFNDAYTILNDLATRTTPYLIAKVS